MKKLKTRNPIAKAVTLLKPKVKPPKKLDDTKEDWLEELVKDTQEKGFYD